MLMSWDESKIEIPLSYSAVNEVAHYRLVDHDSFLAEVILPSLVY